MSSHNDMEDKFAGLQIQLEIQQQDSATRIREPKQQVTNPKVESRLSAAKPKDPAPQPTASTGSSETVLRAEISQLQQVLASKDADIAAKDAEIERLCRNTSDLIQSVQSYENGLNAMAREMNRAREAVAAVSDDLHPKESTPKIEVTDTDRSSKPASSSPPNDVKGEGETKPKTPSFGAMSTKVPADAAPARPESAKPNYSQVLQASNPGPVFPKGTLPPGNPRGGFLGGQTVSVFPKTLPPATPQGGFFGGQTGRQQAVSSPFNQQQSVHSDRFPKHETPKERTDQSGREDRGPEKDSTSKPQMGQEAPVYEDKTNLNRVNPDAASYALNTPGTVLDNKGGPWNAKLVESIIRFGAPVPPEVMAAYESGALRVPEMKVSSDPWGASWPKSVNPPTSKPGTGEAGPSKAALEDDKVVPNSEQPAVPDSQESSNAPAQKPETGEAGLIRTSSLTVKKRLADEEQPGTRAPLKRLRSS